MQYKFSKGLIKGFIAFIVFAIPCFINYFPPIANLTIGGVGMILVNYLKVKHL